MQSKFFALMFIVVIACFLSPAFAQQRESGAIIGHITDMEGGGVPGVKVTAQSPERGETVAYTDEEGFYRFPVMAPGTYEVKAELEGFQTVVRSDVRLFVGKTATVDMTASATVQEAVTVTGETPLIDATTTASSKTVPVETIENLPKTSFALDLFTLTPGVGDLDLDYVAYGAGGSQANAYWFDGVDISNPLDGSYWIYPNYNWIEEVNVVGIGAPAEYGGFSGVITNSVSRSGSNEFHGLFETFFENNSMVSNNIDDPAFEDLGPDHIDRFSDTTAQVGGRLIRDKLWFFSSFEYYYDRSNPFGFPPDDSGFIGKVTQPRILNKLTYKVNDDNTLQGFVQWDTWKNTASCSDCRFYLPEATSNSEGPEWFYNTSWVSILNPETVLDVRYSGYNSRLDTTPKNGDIPQHCDANTQICSVNAKSFRLRDRERNQINGSLSYHARDFIHGDHDFKFGIEYEFSNADTVDGYNGGAYYYDGLGLNYYDPTSPNFYRTLWTGYDSFSRIRRTSTFAQDDWQVNDNVRLSVGVRFDHNHAFLEEAANIEYTTNPVAPRVGVVYDVKGDQQTVIKAHYGHYYDKAITFYIDGIDNFGDSTYQYWYGGYWGTYRFVPGTSFYVVDPDFKQTYVQQFTVGVDKALPHEVTLSGHYIYRNFKNIAEDVETNGIYEPMPFVNPVTGEAMTIFNRLNPDVADSFFITNPDGLFRNYHAVEVYGGKRFGRNFSLNGSVVWSRSEGNTNNTDSGADGFTTLFDDPNYQINSEGKPVHDPTWEFKVMGYYNFPWDILGSFYYRHFTGDTFTTTFRPDRGVLAQGRITIKAVPLGSQRLDARDIFDLRLEKAFPIAQGNLKFTADFFNLFNQGVATDLDARSEVVTFLEPTQFTTPRELRIGIRYQF